MKIKKNISKKLLARLAIFIAVVGVATLFDINFDNNAEHINFQQAESSNRATEPGKMYFVSQLNTFKIQSSFQKDTGRKHQVQTHDKFIQKYHQIRNNQVLKAEVQTQTTPLILSYHYLAFRNYFFAVDDDPLLA